MFCYEGSEINSFIYKNDNADADISVENSVIYDSSSTVDFHDNNQIIIDDKNSSLCATTSRTSNIICTK